MRRCSKCGETKPLSEFHKAKAGLYGRDARCKPCRKDIARTYNADPKVKERLRKTAKLWAENNRERICERIKRYQRRHPELVAARSAIYRAKNKGKRRFWQAARNKRIKVATPSWADQESIMRIYEGCPDGHHVDHIIPIKAMRGRVHIACGLHFEGNLQYLTAIENQRKSASIPEEYAS